MAPRQQTEYCEVHLICFSSLRENSCFMYLSGFLAVYGREAIPIAVNPSWSEADVGINIL